MSGNHYTFFLVSLAFCYIVPVGVRSLRLKIPGSSFSLIPLFIMGGVPPLVLIGIGLALLRMVYAQEGPDS